MNSPTVPQEREAEIALLGSIFIDENIIFAISDLLSPDEILQAIKPKGKTKRYGGSCIIFVDEFKPFFLSKYDTLSHPLIEVTGSSFEKDLHNNTNIEDCSVLTLFRPSIFNL